MSTPPALNCLIPELICTSAKVSIAFYTELLGFKMLYQREEKGFAMLERQGSQLMLDELVPDSSRSWYAAPLEKPFGRGINISIETDKIDELYACIQRAGVEIFLPLEERWYRANDVYLGVRQFIVQDPDGYLLRFSQNIGCRQDLAGSNQQKW